MTKPLIDENGASIQTFDEVYEELAQGFRDIYGADIDLSQNTPDGQRIGILAGLSIDMQQFGLDLHGQIDPDFSRGDFLNKIIKWAGIERGAATKSSVNIDVTTDRNLVLFSGFKVVDEAGQIWQTVEELTLSAGINSVGFVAELFGKIEAPANTINSLSDIVLGVLSVNNPLAAIAGIDEETEEQLRIRRNRSTENPSYSTTGSLQSKLGDLEGVQDVLVYENDTDTLDTVRDIEPHTLWIVILGGLDSDIARVGALQKTGGTGLKGAESATYNETIIRPSGNDYIKSHVINFDRATQDNIFVKANIKRRDPSVPIDAQLIADKIAEKEYFINEAATATELYANAYQAGTSFIVTDLMISDDNITFTNEEISGNFGGYYFIDSANVVLTEV